MPSRNGLTLGGVCRNWEERDDKRVLPRFALTGTAQNIGLMDSSFDDWVGTVGSFSGCEYTVEGGQKGRCWLYFLCVPRMF